MKKFKKLLVSLLILNLLLTACVTGQPAATPDIANNENVAGLTERVVTDQLGREVVIPSNVTSIATSHGAVTNMVVSMGGAPLIVGTGPKASGRTILHEVAPYVMDTPQIGQQAELNLEQLASINPDVFVLSARNRTVLEDLELLGIPGIAIDPENFDTLFEAMRIIGAVIGKEEHAEEIIRVFDAKMASIKERTTQSAAIPSAIAIGRQNLTDVAVGNMIQNEIILAAGARNAAEDVEPHAQGSLTFVDVGLEQILEWNPDFIFIHAFGNIQPEDFFNEPRLESVAAVVNRNVFKFPSDADAWDMPLPMAVLAVMWAAHTMHPDLITAEELDTAVEDFYYLLHGVRLGRDYFRY
jgi:iron complex transport system substrate-binding protein